MNSLHFPLVSRLREMNFLELLLHGKNTKQYRSHGFSFFVLEALKGKIMIKIKIKFTQMRMLHVLHWREKLMSTHSQGANTAPYDYVRN